MINNKIVSKTEFSSVMSITVYFNFSETLFLWISSRFHKVGDLSPKGRVGASRLALVFGWKSDSKPVGNTNCRPNTGALSASADQPFGERLPTT
jgi:hypothetical protein